MAVRPVTVPAAAERVYDLPRVAAFSATQRAGAGSPVLVSYQVEFYRLTGAGPEDAPAGTGAAGTVQVGIPELSADPRLAAAVATLHEYCLADALRAGRLTPAD